MTVDFALLAVLANGPRPESWLGQELASCHPGLPAPSAGQVSAALGRLAGAGLVAADRGHDPAQFLITASGQRELTGWLRTTRDPASSDELVLKIMLAAQVPGTDVHEVIQVHRRYLVQLMQQWTRIKDDEADSGLGLALAVDAELFRLGSVVWWLDVAEDRLQGAAADTFAAPEPGQIRTPLPRHRRETRIAR